VARVARDHPVSIVLFDLLHLNGHPLLEAAYDQRRALLEQLGLSGPSFAVTPSFTDEAGTDVLAAAVRIGMEGVVAKRRASPYRPGRRSPDWIKVKHQRTQEVVVGGYTRGEGNRRSTFGALLLGIPSGPSLRTLTFVGKVGSDAPAGAQDHALRHLARPDRGGRRPALGAPGRGRRGGVHRVDPGRAPPPSGVAWATDGQGASRGDP
jgi:bifunctional non-homologous end joining protein LigD